MKKIIKQVFNFYYEGFRNMGKTGRNLWIIIIIKLAIMFLVLKIFFFPNYLNSRFDTEKEKSTYIHQQLIKTKANEQR